MPPNDPRFLEVTEEEILRDLLVRGYHQDNLSALLHPSTAEADDPDIAEKFEAARDRLASSDAFIRGVQALLRGGKTEEQATAGQGAIRLKRGENR